MMQDDDAVDVLDFPPAKSIVQVLKEALGEQPVGFAAAALLAGSFPGQDDSMPLWLAKQLGSDPASSLSHAAGVSPNNSGLQMLQQGSLVTGVTALAKQQSGLQMLCDPVIVR